MTHLFGGYPTIRFKPCDRAFYERPLVYFSVCSRLPDRGERETDGKNGAEIRSRV
jgi:hypothetical protein